jgi:septal ring factor EnvC (AmiA/AmiB activator)
MNEQRVSDLIEQLQRFGDNTRIEGYVNLKWNDKRTAIVATEDNLLDQISTLTESNSNLVSQCDELEEDVKGIARDNKDLEKENSALAQQCEEHELTIESLERQVSELEAEKE